VDPPRVNCPRQSGPLPLSGRDSGASFPEMTRIGGLSTQKFKFDEANDQFFTNGGEFCLPSKPGCHLNFPC